MKAAPLYLALGMVALIVFLVRPGGAHRPALDEVRITDSVTVVSVAPILSQRPTDPIDNTPVERTPGAFVFLFDVSGSVRRARDAFSEGADLLVPSLQAMRSMKEVLPMVISVGTIGSLSLRQKPMCRLVIKRPKIFSRDDTTNLVARMHACDARLRSVPVELATDIRGGLAYAASLVQGNYPALRGIIIVSDLVEEPVRNSQPAMPDLRGTCVFVFTPTTDESARYPMVAAERRGEWEQRLATWGTRTARVRVLSSFQPSSLTDFFRECEQ